MYFLQFFTISRTVQSCNDQSQYQLEDGNIYVLFWSSKFWQVFSITCHLMETHQAPWKAWCTAGVIGWENLIQIFGIWFLAVWCGSFGRKEIGVLLRIPRNPWFNYKLYAKRLYLIGLGVGASQIVPLSWSLFRLLVLFKFFLVVCCCLVVCCISLCSPSWTPCICFLLFFSSFN